LYAEMPPCRCELSLHRGGHLCLQAKFEPPMPCNPHGACSSSYGRVGRWQEMPDGRLRLWGFAGDRVLLLERTETGYICREENYPEGGEFPYDSLSGFRFRQVT